MSAGGFKGYLSRSVDILRKNSARVLRAEAVPDGSKQVVWRIDRDADLSTFATGADSDIGGQSKCTLDKDEEGNGRFWGEIRSDVKQEYQGKVRGGYVGFRNKSLPTLFGHVHYDLSIFSHLAFDIRPSGELQTLSHWFVNLQTDGPVRSDLFQHRLLIPSSPDDLNKWTKVYVPLSSFVLTNSGALSETQVGMMRNKVRTVGLSLLASEREAIDQSNGGGSLGVDGRFELGIRSVEAVNLGDRSLESLD